MSIPKGVEAAAPPRVDWTILLLLLSSPVEEAEADWSAVAVMVDDDEKGETKAALLSKPPLPTRLEEVAALRPGLSAKAEQQPAVASVRERRVMLSFMMGVGRQLVNLEWR